MLGVAWVQKIKKLVVLESGFTGESRTVTVEDTVCSQPSAVVPFTSYVVVEDGFAYTVAIDDPV
jgi:hypothetical protein